MDIPLPAWLSISGACQSGELQPANFSRLMGMPWEFHPVNMEIQLEIREKHGLNMGSTSVDHRFLTQ